MKLTKKTETEVLKVYDTWLHSYLTGDVKTYDLYLDDAYHFIGSTNNEEFLSRKDTTKFFQNTAEQLAGKTELRNESKTLEKFGELIFITHVFDAWFLANKTWMYYGRFRFSSVLRKNKEGWRFIYQHFSMPDSKAQDGETIGYDQISAENLQLREAIKRRTFELENKNRELEIEAALERIRAQAMAMRESADLLDIVVTMRSEFIKLGHEAHYFWHMRWLPEIYEKAMTSGDGTRIGMVMKLPRHIHGDIALLDKWEKGKKPTVIYSMDVEAALAYIDKMVTLGDFQQVDPQAPSADDIRHIGGLTFVMARTTHGEIGYSLPGAVEQVPQADLDILVRFAGAFDLAHKRFEDLKKSEQQSREVQIELALEKVRSRTMGMQESSELKDVVKVIFDQLAHLSISAEHAGIVVDYEPKKDWHFWIAETQDVPAKVSVPYLDLVWDRQFTEAKKKGKDFFTTQLDFDEKNSFYKVLLPHIEGLTKKARDFYFSCPGLAISTVIEKDIGLYIENFSGMPYSSEENDILKRFAKVFQQTYTRFLDLQKAEAQAREAQIEAALEKVRSHSLAMHKSEELKEVVAVVLEKLQELNIAMESRVAVIVVFSEESRDFNQWVASPTDIANTYISTPYFEHIILSDFWKAKESGLDFYSKSYSKDEKNKYFKYFFENSFFENFEGIEDQKKWALEKEFYTYSPAFEKNSSLGIADFSGEPLVENEIAIIKRFAKVFEQAYIRFLDLQKAEAQSRESQIEAALERVRSMTMGMQKSEELGDVAAVLFKELNRLVDNLWTCGFVLCEEGRDEDEWWLSDENGFIPAFYLPNVGDDAHSNIYNAWKNGADYHTEQLEGEALQKHYDWLMNIPVAKKIFDEMMATGFELPTWQKLHCAYFKTGYLVIITQVPCAEEDIFKRFAQVFDLTYTRFLDLQLKEEQAVKLVEEKQRLEVTLNDLRATQAQLIQSEKMASLGELTAGIAHEIQNPLNFVNNFSEVSNELIDEMKEEFEKGDKEEAYAIAADIKQNLEKIHHHGKRADGIVKGMLQHSRSSSGIKEPTDLNVLADEYLRLAYHGLRAKDKMFNATLETHFDESIGKVNVMAQDMGRVILNLITNAFYVVKEKSSEALAKENGAYEPTVTVSTKKTREGVEISVKDNGNGIPEAIKEKIFQPFFTTKPTGQGTGLGLSMSYDIVTKGHGGELKVDTKEGQGTTFLISIPFEVQNN